MRTTIGTWVFMGLIGVFVATNVVFSQRFPRILSQIVRFDAPYEAEVFLQSIENLPEAAAQKSYFNSIYRTIYAQKMSSHYAESQKVIDAYTLILGKNPHSRDANIKIALAYAQIGDVAKAKEYYAKAQMTDPSVMVVSLERLSH